MSNHRDFPSGSKSTGRWSAHQDMSLESLPRRMPWLSCIQAAAIMACCLAGAMAAPTGHAQTVVDPTSKSNGTLSYGLQFGGQISVSVRKTLVPPTYGTQLFPTGTGISSNRTGSVNAGGLDFFTPEYSGNKIPLPNVPVTVTPTIRMSILAGGNVGIGTTAPTRALEIDGKGDVELGLKSSDGGGTLWTLQSTGVTTPATSTSLNGYFQIFDRNQNVSRLKIDSTGKVEVSVLQIDGGSDVAEPFKLQGRIAEGSVVVIDDKHPGQLRMTDQAYDTRVAGIVSGAGGVHPGLSLQQSGLNDGQNVALSGRVYAFADASEGPIHPGDLLTTAPRRGHCMKAADPQASRGAILGKAMSSLEQGQGLVLVLVTLQ